jgi:hypothetical protein
MFKWFVYCVAAFLSMAVLQTTNTATEQIESNALSISYESNEMMAHQETINT